MKKITVISTIFVVMALSRCDHPSSGGGTTTPPTETKNVLYRLGQVDFDSTVHYHPLILKVEEAK